MKRICIIFSLIVFSLAQTGHLKAQTPPVKLGIKVAPNIAWMAPETKDYEYDGVSGGLTAGLVTDIYFAEHYAFSTGFNFAFLNGKLKYTDSLALDTGSVAGQMYRKYKFIYLDIPYMVKMQTRPFGNFSFYGQIGFSTGFRLSAKARDYFDPENGAERIEENHNITSETTLIRQAVLFGIGFEYHLDENTRIFLGFSYSNSLNNILTGHNTYSGYNQKSLFNFVEANLGILF